MSLRLAVATEDFGSNLKRSIGNAASCRVDGVRLNTRTELDAINPSETATRQILLYVKERELKTAGLYCPTKHALYAPEFLEPRIDIIRKSMSLVRQLETKELIVRCGTIPDPDIEAEESQTPDNIDDSPNPFTFTTASTTKSPAAEFSLLSEVLNDLVQHGNHVGCTLTLQLNDYNQRLIRQLFAEVNQGPLQLVFDPATAVMTGASVDGTYRDLYNHVGYVRARDAVQNVDGAGTEVAPGRGVVDWVTLMPTLVEADYQGWICIERTGGDSRAEDVERGVSYLNELIPQTGD